MLHIVKSELRNWLCYRGEYTLELQPKVYGISARYEGNPERSNWGGKTTLMYGLAFPVTGVKPPCAIIEDKWITDGEPDGYVRNTYSDGTVIARSRIRGKSTQLVVRPGDGGGELTGDEATKWIIGWMGLSEKDLFATCFIRQKQMEKIVTDQPGERFKTFSAWLRLAPLQRAAERVRKVLVAADGDLQSLTTEATVERKGITEILAAYFDDVEDVDLKVARTELDSMRTELAAVEASKKQAAEQAKEKRRELDRWRDTAKRAGGHAALVEQLVEAKKSSGHADLVVDLEEAKRVAAAIPAVDETAQRSVITEARRVRDDAAVSKRATEDERRQKAQLACGSFDGKCPVDGHLCPDKGTMNERRSQNAKLLADAKSAADAAAMRHVKLGSAVTDAENVLEEARSKKAKAQSGIVELQGKIAKAQAKIADAQAKVDAIADDVRTIAEKGQPPTNGAIERAEAEAWDAYQQAAGAVRDCDRHIASFDAKVKKLADIAERRAIAGTRIDTYREAFLILGRNGAQRRMCERARAQITQNSNALLGANGIDLSVELSWSREAGGLAVQCDICGTAFPTSQKIKLCERCGAARGPKTIDGLMINLSNPSDGAAADLAGGAIQLAAAAWLRTERDSRWGVAWIDEPFGSLDTFNRKLFATHLQAMLQSRYGFAQAFVVAHEPGIVASLPGRILIEATEDRSSVAEVG